MSVVLHGRRQENLTSSDAFAWALPVVLFAAALVVRLPRLLLVPRFEDEGIEILWALDIAHGKRLPLTGFDAYYGPLSSYLLAALFRLFGANIFLPRLLAAVFGALTVPAIYMLGRTIANRRAGLLAAVLALTSPALAIVSSHYGWSNSLTPFFATVTIWAVYVGTRNERPWLVGLGGLLAALTMQTHPLSLVLVISLGIWCLRQRSFLEWLKRGEFYAGVDGFVLGYAPMLWMLLVRGGVVIRRVGLQVYAYVPVSSLAVYQERLWKVTSELVTAMAATNGQVWAAFASSQNLRASMSVVTATLVLAGLVFAVRDDIQPKHRGSSLLAYAFLGPLLLLPLLTPVYYIRYLALIIPCGCVCGGVALDRFVGLAASFRARSRDGGLGSPQWWLTAILIVAITAANLKGMSRIYQQQDRDRLTNAPFFAVSDTLAREGCRNGVLVEETDVLKVGSDRAWVFFNFHAVDLVLEMGDCRLTELPATRLLDAIKTQPLPAWLIIPEQSVSDFSRMVVLDRAMAIDAGPAVSPGLRLVLFRVRRRVDGGGVSPSSTALSR